jgi:hypothetical protein
MSAVRAECARLASTASGREALAQAARFDEDAWVRLNAATAVGTWDREVAADALTALIVAAGGTVARPLTMTDALAIGGEIGTSAALCLMNLDRGDTLELPSPAPPERRPALPSADLDAAETVYSLAMNGGIEHAYEAVGPQFPAAAAAFDAVGAPTAGQVLRDAVRLLGPDEIPDDRESRVVTLMALPPDAEEQFTGLSSQLWSMHDLMDRLELATEA